VIEPVAEPHPVEKIRGPVAGIGSAPKLRGHHHVLQRRECGQETKGLENKADVLIADLGTLILV